MKKMLLALGGATGSGKTALAIELAKEYPQLVILSADSRQIYKRLDVGSAKVGEPSTDPTLTGRPEPVWLADGVPQYLIDIAEPNTTFTLADYQREAYHLMEAAWQKNRVPFLVGGTGLYLQAVIEGYPMAGEPDLALRQELETLTVAQLQARLHELGGSVVATDAQNKRRLVRAIERTISASISTSNQTLASETHAFVLNRDWEAQRMLAPAMVRERLDLGLVAETEQLLSIGIDREWLKSMGLSYRLVIRVLDGEFGPTELETRMINEFRQLMRRQRTWFNRMSQAELLDADGIRHRVSEVLTRSE